MSWVQVPPVPPKIYAILRSFFLHLWGLCLSACYNPYMPWLDKEKQREAIRRHYYANRQLYIDKAMKKRSDLRKWLYEQKEKSPCMDCGTCYPYYVMDYDHLKEKNMNISEIINSGSISRLKTELGLCELVCANCHRIRTFARLKQTSTL